ncbi:peroxidase 57-like [Argentina anserina]|uniref:peroxidase 57-like n=1 Tax=Argentina anserina TaxID=57926 RepID=UPI00217672D1|nr:peroxidase 57-like [Potentilla anserina]
MAHHLLPPSVILIFTLFTITILPSEGKGQGLGNDLHVGFYSRSCPQVEDVVAEIINRHHEQDPKTTPAFIRLLFHDCFVKGCDASILLDESVSGSIVEKADGTNGKTLRGLEIIDEIKAELENQCPQTVSCADIIAFASREAVALSGLPRHDVPAGRRDTRTSRNSDIEENLPTPEMTVQNIIKIFSVRNFSVEDMVVLSGAHSIGQSHCDQIRKRIYTFRPGQGIARDPFIDPAYADELAQKCPALPAPDETFSVDFDPVTPEVLDNQYYLNLQNRKGLLETDQVLAFDPNTVEIVNQMAADPEGWTKRFVKLMIRLGRLSVLTKNDGEIRINCRKPNQQTEL